MLVVDDDEATRVALEKAVRAMGHPCRSAGDGHEALLLHQAEHADVILSDWEMPGVDGLELCRRTRVADGDKAYTYFIFLTGFGDKDHFIAGMESGADDYQTKPVDLDELRARLVSAGRVVAMHRQLREKNTALRRDSQASFGLARTDPLTGIANRLRLDEDLRDAWAHAARYGRRYSVALCDVDWFKIYNDHLGHLAGDAVLKRVAEALASELRSTDRIYRYGGEEFLVLFPEQSVKEAAVVAERMRLAVQRLRVRTIAGDGVVTVSIGVAERRPEDQNVAGWLNRADAALYQAKDEGRNRVKSDSDG
ncbi:MAG TPA: diguanylate cyclase [Polyangiaceae bacterium]|nr:diguanylate cyclase [Polyangiaceae bacterium]